MIPSGAEFLSHQLRVSGGGGGVMGAVEAIGSTADDAARALPGAAAVVVGGALASFGALTVLNRANQQDTPGEASEFASTWKPRLVGAAALTAAAGVGAIAARGSIPFGGAIGAGLLSAAAFGGSYGAMMSTDVARFEERFAERAAWEARQSR